MRWEVLVNVTAPRLLLVEDDPVVRRAVARALGRAGYTVVDVPDAEEALVAARQGPVDVALIDLGLPDGRSGLDVLRELKALDPATECVVFTGDGSAGRAVDAYDAGAAAYLEKPITDWDRFHAVLERAVAVSRLARARDAEADATPTGEVLRRMLVGHSRGMEDLRRQIERLAPRNTTVLLLGPTGSGKTRVAQALHVASGRKGAFEIVNCGGVHEGTIHAELFGHAKAAFTGAEAEHRGAFERTADGTLVLDEIGDLPLELQALLLQVLEDRVFRPMKGTRTIAMTSRVVAATHRDIDELVRQGRFRADLANRLGIRLKVPGLDERREDIPQLVYTFLREINDREGLDVRKVSPEVLDRLVHHDWSGENLRGLRTAVERMAIFARGDALAPEDLALGTARPSVAAPAPADGLPDAWRDLPYAAFKEAVLADYVGRYVRALLQEHGTVAAAARAAELHGPNFRRLVRRYGVRIDG